MWAMGIYQTAIGSKQTERLNSLYGLTVFGFALTWLSGWLMMKHLGLSMSASWISNAMLFGLISMVGSFLRAFSQEKGKVYGAMMFIGFALSIASMIVRSENGTTLSVLSGVAVSIGFLAAWRFTTASDRSVEGIDDAVLKGFKWMAWVEGATVLVLFLLYLPAKKVLNINLDGGTGLIGWTHGVFVILYVLSLTFTFRQQGWSWKHYIMGGVSSFFPFGTFVFEKKMEGALNSKESKVAQGK
jgi:integral membrane protein